MSIPVVALVGRPNVGKSMLFNRLLGEQDAAIVSEVAGTTRDRHFGRGTWNGRDYWLVDTGGVPDDESLPMDAEIRKQVSIAIEEADLLLFVVDAKLGLVPSDEKVAEILRDSGKPWLLVANKSDKFGSIAHYEFYQIGAGDPMPVSAMNGMGTGELLDRMVESIPAAAEEEPDGLRVAVIGRPNVGKSSLVNKLIGEDRLVVSDIPGTTRDAIDSPIMYHGRRFVFVDTAGLRRQSRVDDGIEFYSTLRTRRAIERAEICVLVLDATLGLENQDLKIANISWEMGRGLIVVVNKWDIKEEKTDKSSAHFVRDAGEKAPFLKFVPFVFTSALTGQRVNKILDLILQVEQERQKRISTSEINDTLGALVARRQPPQAAGHEIKLKYASQVETAPPAIGIWGNHPELVQEHYVRYLHNGFREAYGFLGNPLRMLMKRKGD
jgi:GTPase